jgi:bifunctional UDP-N-acetylglucosamine pyrophosphorylase/glucosamine-1-phosphate N-acetyltransferase
MQAVVLAAGMGTRLRPLTDTRSKAMITVLGRPLVERAIAPLLENEIRDLVFVVASDDHEIRSHFTDGGGSGIRARCVVQEPRLGTAHALGVAAELIEGPFAVWACDSLVDRHHVAQLLAAATEADAALSVLDVEPELVSRSAAVRMDGDAVRRIVEKPSVEDAPSLTVSLPHYVFTPRLLELLPRVDPSPRGEYELADAIQKLIEEGGRVVGVRATHRHQVSTPDDLLAETRRLLAAAADAAFDSRSTAGRGTRLIGPYRIEHDVVIGRNCEIGPEVYLEFGCRIGEGAVLRRSIVLREARVAAGELLEDAVIS